MDLLIIVITIIISTGVMSFIINRQFEALGNLIHGLSKGLGDLISGLSEANLKYHANIKNSDIEYQTGINNLEDLDKKTLNQKIIDVITKLDNIEKKLDGNGSKKE